MKKMKVIAAVLLVLALLLPGAACLAAEDFSDIAGVWYTEEVMMQVAENGRFVLEWNDEDWAGSLKPERRTNEYEEEYTAWRMILDNPGLSMWKDLELVSDVYVSGKVTFVHDGTPGEVFWNVPVYVLDVSGEDLSYYEPYAYIDTANGEEPAITMMFTLLRPATDIGLLQMFDQYLDEEGELCYNGTTIEWWEAMDSQERIVVTHVFEGELPDLCFSFLGEDETRYDFAVDISGGDGQLYLWPLVPSNG